MEGHSIFRQPTAGSSRHFDRFSTALKDVNSELSQSGAQELALPTCICMGDRSAGKSSSMENVTKCSIFPVDDELCTLMPIRLRLKKVSSETDCSVSVTYQGVTTPLASRDDVLGRVQQIMRGVNGISREELTVQICQMDVPSFEFVDLPGLQTYPAEMQRQTREVVDRYLSEPDTLVLCVVDATTPALDSTVPLAMIRDADKLSHTILALTKSDLVRSKGQIEKSIFKRVLGTASEMKHLPRLAGCVAITNRYNRDGQSLQQADQKEADMFGKMLREPAAGYESPEVQARLKSQLGVAQLINKLDDLFGNFIVHRWKPVMLQQLESLKIQAERELGTLGPPVEALSAETVLQAIIEKVDFEAVCTKLRELGPFLPSHIQVAHWGSLEWARRVNSVEQHIKDACMSQLSNGSSIRHMILSAFDAAFTSHPPMNLARFESLQSLLHQLLSSRVEDSLAAATPHVDHVIQDTICKLSMCIRDADHRSIYHMYPSTIPDNAESAICGCIIRSVIQHVDMRPLELPSGFQLEEDFQTGQRRSVLNNRLQKLQTASTKISQFEVNSSGPFQPVPESEVDSSGSLPPVPERSSRTSRRRARQGASTQQVAAVMDPAWPLEM